MDAKVKILDFLLPKEYRIGERLYDWKPGLKAEIPQKTDKTNWYHKFTNMEHVISGFFYLWTSIYTTMTTYNLLPGYEGKYFFQNKPLKMSFSCWNLVFNEIQVVVYRYNFLQ